MVTCVPCIISCLRELHVLDTCAGLEVALLHESIVWTGVYVIASFAFFDELFVWLPHKYKILKDNIQHYDSILIFPKINPLASERGTTECLARTSAWPTYHKNNSSHYI
ncbi:hypothetical protein ACJX0J_017112 [Zea mays]